VCICVNTCLALARRDELRRMETRVAEAKSKFNVSFPLGRPFPSFAGTDPGSHGISENPLFSGAGRRAEPRARPRAARHPTLALAAQDSRAPPCSLSHAAERRAREESRERALRSVCVSVLRPLWRGAPNAAVRVRCLRFPLPANALC
jgi:hypothetical protein